MPRRVPLLAGSRIPVVTLPDEAVLLRPPEPLDPIADVGTAVEEALRYPLAGPPLEELATRGGRATVVVDPPLLPLPGAPADPRQDALAAVLGMLAGAGVPAERQTILVAGGLERRAGQPQLEELLHPALARQFDGDCTGAFGHADINCIDEWKGNRRNGVKQWMPFARLAFQGNRRLWHHMAIDDDVMRSRAAHGGGIKCNACGLRNKIRSYCNYFHLKIAE